jgi:tetrapyrrole methylase family protein/MazG family protein
MSLASSIENFSKTIKALRDPETGCPWNREQTNSSLKRYLYEELYECLEAIDHVEIDPTSERNWHELKEELGDVLLQVALHSEIAAEKNAFDLAAVIDQINEKMIRRHPHVFADVSVSKTSDVDTHWEKIKKQEKAERKSIFEGIPKELPSLARAWKISKKAVRESFEWDEEHKLWQQLDSEINEFKEVVDNKKSLSASEKAEAELELGDILFTVVNVARWHAIDPEDALRKTNNKFTERFDIMQAIIKAKNPAKSMKDYTLNELEEFWQQAKHEQINAQSKVS